MKKLISALTALAVLIIAGVNFVSASSTSASETVTKIGENIRNHAASIQSENDKLLHTAPEVLAAADFSQYDTSNKLLGAKLFDFNEPSRIPYGDDIEDVINGRDNRIYTIGGGKYEVHTLKAAKGYPNVFANDLVLRSASGERAALNSAYAKDIPEYQVIKNLKNIYVENVDFNDFYSIKFEYCDNIIFNNCTFNNFTNNGLVFFGCTNVSVVNCSFVNCGNKMSDNTNGGYSIRVVGSKERPSSGILIENCNIDNSCGKAVSFTGSVDDYVVRNNKITKTVWGAIDYWSPDVSGKYVNVIENNVCTDIGFGVPSVNDAAALTSGVGCAAIFAGSGSSMPRTVVKNNTVENAVETAIEGPYELVYRNTVRNTGENSVKRYTASTEAVYIKPASSFEQKYICNDIETRGLRCFSAYSDSDEEYASIYIMNNKMNLKDGDASITQKYTRSDVEINCRRLKKLVISGNVGMMTDKPSVNIYVKDKGYTMDTLVIDDPCMRGNISANVKTD